MFFHPIPKLTEKQEELFWAKVSVPYQPSCCWEWTGALCGSGGYGAFGNNKNIIRAHRLSYTMLIGEIPDGMIIDHLCKNKKCVNPDHIRIVDHSVNGLKVYRKKPVRKALTHCPHGHEYTEQNTYIHPRKNYRVCRKCRTDAQKERVAGKATR